MTHSVYFASDAHFGAGRRDDQIRRVERFSAWVAGLEDSSHLYLLGDLFDFWFDYPNFMPKLHMEVLYALRRAMDRGVEVVFVGGNHDAWCESFFEQTLGVPVVPSGDVVEHQGLRLRLHHGDGLLTGDRGYKVFRAFVRHPVPIFLARCLHPELLHAFAMWLSRRSRALDRDTADDIIGFMRKYGRAHSHADVDHLVIGHVHTPTQLPFDGWTMTCLGDWIGHFTAGRLQAGHFELVEVDERGRMHPLDTEPTASAT